MQIRRARLADLPVLKEFEQGIVQAERSMDSSLAPDPISYYDLEELVNSPEAEVVVVEIDGELAGSGYAKVKDAKPYLDHEKYAYVGFMFTLPEWRGQGIAKMILDHLCEWTKKRGLNEVRLEVYDQNDPAIRAYEKAGFSKNLVEMRKRI